MVKNFNLAFSFIGDTWAWQHKFPFFTATLTCNVNDCKCLFLSINRTGTTRKHISDKYAVILKGLLTHGTGLIRHRHLQWLRICGHIIKFKILSFGVSITLSHISCISSLTGNIYIHTYIYMMHGFPHKWMHLYIYIYMMHGFPDK